MNFKKINKQLNKIKNLIDNISEEDRVSSIEKELLQSYIKNLYELTLKGKVNEEQNAKTSALVEEALAPAPAVAVSEELVKEIIEETTTQAIEKAPVKENITKSEAPILSEPVMQKVIEVAAPEPEKSVVTDKPEVSVPEVPTQVAEPKEDYSPEMMDLFSETKIKDLSDRLTMLPIGDLTKCMGINEKIFTIKELFGGKQDLFLDTMNHLNSLSNFSDAKSYLMAGVANDMEWDTDDKVRKARNLVTLVMRRYM